MEYLPDRFLKEITKHAKQARALNVQLIQEKTTLPREEVFKMVISYLKSIQITTAALLKSANIKPKHIQDTSTKEQ